MGNVIDAVDDSYSVDTDVSGVIPVSNVLGNDTINGEVVAATDVVLTSTPTDELTINEDGSVSVAPVLLMAPTLLNIPSVKRPIRKIAIRVLSLFR